MYQKIILILFILNGELVCAASVADSWILFAKALKDSWSHCPVELGLFQCFKQSSWEVFDKMITADVIPLAENVRLERYRPQTKISFNSDASVHNNIWKRSSLLTEPWSEHILKKIVELFKTHTLSIGRTSNEGRRRRHQNNMLPMAVLGVTAFGVFAVPVGFQFLLIVCGKAVLLSKMALLLSSINGSRRVEHSGAHHGLYSPDIHSYGHGYHNWNKEDITQPRSTEM